MGSGLQAGQRLNPSLGGTPILTTTHPDGLSHAMRAPQTRHPLQILGAIEERIDNGHKLGIADLIEEMAQSIREHCK